MNPLELEFAEKKQCLELLKTYVRDEWEEEIGDLKAELFFDFLTANIGKLFYNKGVQESRKFLLKKVEDLEFEFDQVTIY